MATFVKEFGRCAHRPDIEWCEVSTCQRCCNLDSSMLWRSLPFVCPQLTDEPTCLRREDVLQLKHSTSICRSDGLSRDPDSDSIVSGSYFISSFEKRKMSPGNKTSCSNELLVPCGCGDGGGASLFAYESRSPQVQHVLLLTILPKQRNLEPHPSQPCHAITQSQK